MPEIERHLVADHPLGDHATLSLRAERGSVHVRGVDGTVCHIEARYRTSSSVDPGSDPGLDGVVRIEPSGSELRVEVLDREGGRGLTGKLGRIVGNGRATVDFEVLLPRQAQLRLSGVTSDMRVEGIHADLEIRTVSGSVRVADANGRVVIKTVSADAEVRGTTISVNGSTTSGDLYVEGQRLEQVQITSVSGAIRLGGGLADGPRHSVESVSGRLALAPLTGVTVSMRGLSGGVHSSGPVVQELRHGSRIVVVGDGAADLQFRTISGDLDILEPGPADSTRWGGAAKASPVVPVAPVMPVARVASPMPSSPVVPAASVLPALPDASRSPDPPAVDTVPVLPAASADAEAADQLQVLRALERGEIDVDEASRRLAGTSLHG